MSTNLEYRARERQRKSGRPAKLNEKKGDRDLEREIKKTNKQTIKKTKETFFVGAEQHENFVAAVTKLQMLAATNAS